MRIFLIAILISILFSCLNNKKAVIGHGSTIVAFLVNDTFFLASDSKETFTQGKHSFVSGYHKKIDYAKNVIFGVAGLSSIPIIDGNKYINLDILPLLKSCISKYRLDSALYLFEDSLKKFFYSYITPYPKRVGSLYDVLGNRLIDGYIFTYQDSKPVSLKLQTIMFKGADSTWHVSNKISRIEHSNFFDCIGMCDEVKDARKGLNMPLEGIPSYMIEVIRLAEKRNRNVGGNIDLIKFYNGSVSFYSDTLK